MGEVIHGLVCLLSHPRVFPYIEKKQTLKPLVQELSRRHNLTLQMKKDTFPASYGRQSLVQEKKDYSVKPEPLVWTVNTSLSLNAHEIQLCECLAAITTPKKPPKPYLSLDEYKQHRSKLFFNREEQHKILNLIASRAKKLRESNPKTPDQIVEIMRNEESALPEAKYSESWLTQFKELILDYRQYLNNNWLEYRLIKSSYQHVPPSYLSNYKTILPIHLKLLELVWLDCFCRIKLGTHFQHVDQKINGALAASQETERNELVAQSLKLLDEYDVLLCEFIEFRLMFGVCSQFEHTGAQTSAVLYDVGTLVIFQLETILVFLEKLNQLAVEHSSELNDSIISPVYQRVEHFLSVANGIKIIECLPRVNVLSKGVQHKLLVFKLVLAPELDIKILTELEKFSGLPNTKPSVINMVFRRLTMEVKKAFNCKHEELTLSGLKQVLQLVTTTATSLNSGWLSGQFFIVVSRLRGIELSSTDMDLPTELAKFEQKISKIEAVVENTEKRFKKEQHKAKTKLQKVPPEKQAKKSSRKTKKTQGDKIRAPLAPSLKETVPEIKVSIDPNDWIMSEVEAKCMSKPAEALTELSLLKSEHQQSQELTIRIKVAQVEAIAVLLTPILREIQANKGVVDRASVMVSEAMVSPPHNFGNSELFESAKRAIMALEAPHRSLQDIYKKVSIVMSEAQSVEAIQESTALSMIQAKAEFLKKQITSALEVAKSIDEFISLRYQHLEVRKGYKKTAVKAGKSEESKYDNQKVFELGSALIKGIIPPLEQLDKKVGNMAQVSSA
ncbi:hypothetical protein [Parashewanella spongiae]|uniref:hypothetical protein n=1 Tax=Parashewanella spongiae TaxID=342950 RepID=UPI0011AE8C77|nr:hypothetical protein [Parashewanella spongiae]